VTMATDPEQLIELIVSLRPLAGPDPETVRTILGEHDQLAHATIGIMRDMGLIDAGVLEDVLAKMIPGDDGKPMYDLGDSSRMHPSTMPHAPPIPVANSNATRTPSASYTIPAPAPAYPSADYRREPPTGPRASIYSAAIPPPPPPATVAPLPAFAQAFPPDQQELMRTVITLSQAQIDALPADKQMVFTALVCLLSRPTSNI